MSVSVPRGEVDAMSKLMTGALVATGYVFGARAGRDRYDQIKNRATKIWTNPKVQQGVSKADDVAEVKENR